MPSPERMQFAVSTDERGSLLPIELSEVPFTVRRLFTVDAAPGGSARGNHVTTCVELLCLTRGSVSVQLGSSDQSLSEPISLDQPGQALLLPAETFVRYFLADQSSVLVLAEQPHTARESE